MYYSHIVEYSAKKNKLLIITVFIIIKPRQSKRERGGGKMTNFKLKESPVPARYVPKK